MTLRPIPPEEYAIQPIHLWDVQNLLLTSGDFAGGQFNSMTVGWGSIGYIWRRPFVQVVVRPVRYTYEFIERYDSFSLCAFPETCRPALQLLGTRSGRDGNKIAEAGLTPVKCSQIAAPAFAEASLVIECRKIYWDDFHPEHFIDPTIEQHYPRRDYHRIYFGEILAIFEAGASQA